MNVAFEFLSDRVKTELGPCPSGVFLVQQSHYDCFRRTAWPQSNAEVQFLFLQRPYLDHIRPYCGKRFSAMSSLAIIFKRLVNPRPSGEGRSHHRGKLSVNAEPTRISSRKARLMSLAPA